MITTFALIALAELGDKSQLVCMALASRHPPLVVFLGAVVAFAVLNGLAVGVGAGLAALIPAAVLSLGVGILFGGFGISTLLQDDEPEEEADDEEPSSRSVFWKVVVLLVFAELGDKTQLAVAGLASTEPPAEVWLGASLALWLVSGTGVLAGRLLLKHLPQRWLNRASGTFFLILAALALYNAVQLWG